MKLVRAVVAAVFLSLVAAQDAVPATHVKAKTLKHTAEGNAQAQRKPVAAANAKPVGGVKAPAKRPEPAAKAPVKAVAAASQDPVVPTHVEPIIVDKLHPPAAEQKSAEELEQMSSREVISGENLVKEIRKKPKAQAQAMPSTKSGHEAASGEETDNSDNSAYANFELSDEDFAVFEEVVQDLGDDFDPSHILTFAVAAGKEACLYEDLGVGDLVDPEEGEAGKVSTLAGALFMSGGSGRDIQFTIMSPSGNMLDKRLLMREASFSVDLLEPGTYEMCFSNMMSRVSTKVVTVAFHFDKPRPEVEHLKTEDLLPIGMAADGIMHKISGLQKELQFMDRRYKGLHAGQVSLGTRAWFGTAMECVVVVVVAFAQIMYIRHIVEKGQPLLGYSGI